MPPGFKYRYQFLVNGEFVIDETKPHSESKTGRLTNYQIISPAVPQDASALEDIPMPLELNRIPSYLHPDMQKQYHDQFVAL